MSNAFPQTKTPSKAHKTGRSVWLLLAVSLAGCLAPAPAALQDTAPQDTAPQDTAPQDTAPQDTGEEPEISSVAMSGTLVVQIEDGDVCTGPASVTVTGGVNLAGNASCTWASSGQASLAATISGSIDKTDASGSIGIGKLYTTWSGSYDGASVDGVFSGKGELLGSAVQYTGTLSLAKAQRAGGGSHRERTSWRWESWMGLLR